ncbi:hypothetical protein LOTGIDRAFT_77653, partial [Lottia gigantea]
LRTHCLERGCGGIRGLGLMFRHLDKDYSKRITLDEFKDGIDFYGLKLSESYVRKLFEVLDKDNSGGIDFCEFMLELRPELSPLRKQVIDECFNSLDKNQDEILNIHDLKG